MASFVPTYDWQPMPAHPIKISGLQYAGNIQDGELVRVRIPVEMQATFKVPSVDGGREVRLYLNRSDSVRQICIKVAADKSWFERYLFKKNRR